MDKTWKMVRAASDSTLMSMWETLTYDSTEEMAIKFIVETELESRGIIALNEDTFEYEIL